MNNNKHSTLKFISGEAHIYEYMAHHRVEFNLVEFYEISEKQLDEHAELTRMSTEDYTFRKNCNLKHLTDFNANYRPRKKRRTKSTQARPADEMTLGLPEY